MLLRRTALSGVEVVGVVGPATAADADALFGALADAVGAWPRGVVVNLSQAGAFAPAALQVLCDAAGSEPAEPHPALAVCCPTAELAGQLANWLPVHGTVEEAVAAMPDRRSGPRQRLDLESGNESPARARAAAASLVSELDLQPLGDDLAVVVSELVTNALRHASPPLHLELQAGDKRVTVAVADGSSSGPVARDADADAEGGRGMSLVEQLAAETGVRPHGAGKTVWAALARH